MNALTFYLNHPRFCEWMFLIGVITSIKWMFRFIMAVLNAINAKTSCK